VEKESARSGQVSLAEKLRYRIRYLTDGAVFGHAAFVDHIFATKSRTLWQAPHQRSPANAGRALGRDAGAA